VTLAVRHNADRPSADTAALRLERELRRAIITMEFPPGMRLSEQEIAARYGVSRQPVREALITLAKSRLIEILPQRGTTVVKLSVAKMMEARFVREAIEVAVVRRACESFDRTARARLDDLLEFQRSAAARADHNEFQRYDEMFHAALAEGAGCRMAWQALEDIKAHMDRVCNLTLPGSASMLPLVKQHRAIVAAIDRRDPDRAEAAMRLHLTEILRALPRIEAENPALFE
jgi:GntR family transcriptional regulator, rspAB operon transcriptional repressor